ncbi:PPOX class F420-dependent oxidoreductase [Solirubrobacter sp. CPCC 204708]|uniref:PPOX class F420-dependent oxidoreductase n=1 Tax=Solirubrobacter deserti TaxID=2282478 RepID=A0ABT4RTK0_9ACTN|nr:PPOX class F420-dependent oxidoreductase [Solirubrobacter deserti]MBE2315066.1 PPOX class F420-dependent oxidoreductase [Solirubrobacter deserti]MDA0141900.1 PPOX class F420-dependent oxidoreductase [Solirubrobacter deserti]
MPKPPLPDNVKALLAKPLPAVMASLKPDGSPLSVATWYILEDDGRVLINMEDSRARLEHLRKDPRVSITALDENWYTHVSLQGAIVEFAPDSDLKDIDRLSTHYGGNPYPVRDKARTSAWIEIEHWHGWHV